jgi:hypothetical protein
MDVLFGTPKYLSKYSIIFVDWPRKGSNKNEPQRHRVDTKVAEIDLIFNGHSEIYRLGSAEEISVCHSCAGRNL